MQIGPLGIGYATDDGARMLAIVDSATFGNMFTASRLVDPAIREATSSFEHDAPEDAAATFRLSLDGASGYCVRGDGELVFVHSRLKGRGDGLVRKAIADGATHLDCFDGYLVEFYSRHGFVETRREPNWTAGGPDVVFMSRFCCDPQDPRDCAERATCADAGQSGHTSCGTCSAHHLPRHRCGCHA
jgi:hypothetical protein